MEGLGLGYKWYPQDWWTSNSFKRLKHFPIVRYALRELIDLMYKEGGPVEMNSQFLEEDFNISLTEIEYKKLLEFITVLDDGKWWIDSVKKRIKKAQSSRLNGAKGGRPPKNPITQKKNPPKNLRNPPLQIESKSKSKSKIEIEIETKSDYEKIIENDSSCTIEKLKKIYLSNEKLIKALLSVKINKFKNTEHIADRLQQFNEELSSKSQFQRPWSEYTSHFLNWHRKTAETHKEQHQQQSATRKIPIR